MKDCISSQDYRNIKIPEELLNFMSNNIKYDFADEDGKKLL